MKSVLAGASCTAAILAFGLGAYAQTTGQTSGQPAGQSSSQPTAQVQSDQPSQQQTITGCVQREADYRRAHSKGQGGAAGTGAGVGNEFVLVNASSSSAGSTASGTGTTGSTSAPGTAPGTPSTSGSATGTTGTSGASAMNAFELTGPGEGQLQQYIGKRVEVVGRLKGGRAAQSTPGTSTSGTSTTGTTRSASDPMGQDLNLPEFEVVSVREASGSCPSTPDRQ